MDGTCRRARRARRSAWSTCRSRTPRGRGWSWTGSTCPSTRASSWRWWDTAARARARSPLCSSGCCAPSPGASPSAASTSRRATRRPGAGRWRGCRNSRRSCARASARTSGSGRRGPRRRRCGDAAKLAGADEFIAALPAGYDTVLGDGGRALSPGQRRRIGLARAFLRGAPLVILDEPTADLDPASVAVVAAAVERLRAGSTMLVIAHRAELVERRGPRGAAARARRGTGAGTAGGVIAELRALGAPGSGPADARGRRGTARRADDHVRRRLDGSGGLPHRTRGAATRDPLPHGRDRRRALLRADAPARTLLRTARVTRRRAPCPGARACDRLRAHRAARAGATGGLSARRPAGPHGRRRRQPAEPARPDHRTGAGRDAGGRRVGRRGGRVSARRRRSCSPPGSSWGRGGPRAGQAALRRRQRPSGGGAGRADRAARRTPARRTRDRRLRCGAGGARPHCEPPTGGSSASPAATPWSAVPRTVSVSR